MEIKLRPVNQKDWNFILDIRNQEDVRMACYDTSIIDFTTHQKYMQKLNNAPNCHQWIIVCDGKDAGQAKIDDSVLGYMLKDDFRGKGIWSKAYPLVLDEAKKFNFKKLKGTVKFNQEKQLDIAKKLGFEIIGKVFRNNKEVGYDMEKKL